MYSSLKASDHLKHSVYVGLELTLELEKFPVVTVTQDPLACMTVMHHLHYINKSTPICFVTSCMKNKFAQSNLVRR